MSTASEFTSLRHPDVGDIAIVSGGQTGVDRAALDVARMLGIRHGGYCPAGRRAEDGVIPEIYPLRETESPGYRQRTKRNLLESDCTLLLNLGELTGGSLKTLLMAERYGKPVLLLDLDEESHDEAMVRSVAWLSAPERVVVNIAGPREGKRPGAYANSHALLSLVLPKVVAARLERRALRRSP